MTGTDYMDIIASNHHALLVESFIIVNPQSSCSTGRATRQYTPLRKNQKKKIQKKTDHAEMEHPPRRTASPQPNNHSEQPCTNRHNHTSQRRAAHLAYTRPAARKRGKKKKKRARKNVRRGWLNVNRQYTRNTPTATPARNQCIYRRDTGAHNHKTDNGVQTTYDNREESRSRSTAKKKRLSSAESNRNSSSQWSDSNPNSILSWFEQKHEI